MHNTLFLQVILLLCSMFFTCAVIGNAQDDQAQGQDNSDKKQRSWLEKDVKAFLDLPYSKTFSSSARASHLHVLSNHNGVPGFALDIVPSARNNPDSIELVAIASDLSVFRVDITRQKTCESACDLLYDMVTRRIPRWDVIPSIYTPNYSKKSNHVYTLLHINDPLQAWFLDTRQGILFSVEFLPPPQQVIKAPGSRSALISQIDLLYEGLSSLIDGTQQIFKSDKVVYQTIAEAFLAAKKRLPLKIAPNNASKFHIRLFETPVKTNPVKISTERLTKANDVFLNTHYILARTDGQALPIIRFANARDVNATRKEINCHPKDASDLLVVSDSPIETSLRPDGMYQIRFLQHYCIQCVSQSLASKSDEITPHKCDCLDLSEGERTVNVYCIDYSGNVSGWGKLTVTVKTRGDR